MKAQGQRDRPMAEQKEEALNRIYQEYFRKSDEILDKIVDGVSYLKNEKVAKIVADSLHYWDGRKLELICYSIMHSMPGQTMCMLYLPFIERIQTEK